MLCVVILLTTVPRVAVCCVDVVNDVVGVISTLLTRVYLFLAMQTFAMPIFSLVGVTVYGVETVKSIAVSACESQQLAKHFPQ